MTTITYAGGITMQPTLTTISSYSLNSPSRIITHRILDGPAVHTMRDAGEMTGTLTLLFATEQAARDCFDQHRLATVMTISDEPRALLNMSYIVPEGRDVSVRLAALNTWEVVVPFEVIE